MILLNLLSEDDVSSALLDREKQRKRRNYLVYREKQLARQKQKYEQTKALNPLYDRERYQKEKQRNPDVGKVHYQRQITKDPAHNAKRYRRALELHPDLGKTSYEQRVMRYPETNREHWKQRVERDPQLYRKRYLNVRNNSGKYAMQLLRNRLRQLLSSASNVSTSTVLPYTSEELRAHLNIQDDYSGKHIDHKIPAVAFDCNDMDQLRACFSLRNLHLVDAEYNLRKNSRLLPEFYELIEELKPRYVCNNNDGSYRITEQEK